jgi:5-oxoprolinase (ATP-hydrolysing) subunit A
MQSIDLNCDMGESFGAWRMGADAAVMPWITSANIACGFHAGDPPTMLATVRAAAAAGVAIGAHVGLPDLAGFGRRAMAVSPAELYAMTVVQMGALAAVAQSSGRRLVHLKPHGALYHMVEQEPALAQAIVDAIRDVDAGVRLVGLAGGVLVNAGRTAGLAVVHEAFADRRYGDDGRLVPRGQPGAVIEDIGAAVRQALGLAVEGVVDSVEGTRLRIQADSLCVHGDRSDAAAFAQALHEGLRAGGVVLQRLGAAA